MINTPLINIINYLNCKSSQRFHIHRTERIGFIEQVLDNKRQGNFIDIAANSGVQNDRAFFIFHEVVVIAAKRQISHKFKNGNTKGGVIRIIDIVVKEEFVNIMHSTEVIGRKADCYVFVKCESQIHFAHVFNSVFKDITRGVGR